MTPPPAPAAHTPGPWVAGRSDMGTFVEGHESKYVYAGEDRAAFPVAIAYGKCVQKWDEVMANARLIASAPALLAALERAERDLVHLLDKEGVNHSDIDPTVEAARTAIRAARGEG